jgi:hypothetical protein
MATGVNRAASFGNHSLTAGAAVLSGPACLIHL